MNYLYKGKQLVALTAASILSVLLSVGVYFFHRDLGSLNAPLTITAVVLYLLVIAFILVVDWRGFLTMNGAIKWAAMTDRRMVVVGCVFFVGNVFFLGFYLVRAYQKYRNDKQLEPLRQKRKNSRLEFELGMIPPTEGVCHNCQAPLQVGAEFCWNCGKSVMERPRICPICFATTQPEAEYCPKCGTHFDR
jgi:ribosomal protein L40E